MEITVETITPEMAKEYLKNNEKNRPKRDHNFSKMVRDIQAGDWKLNGETIKFNCDGRLLDGQHRLTAVVLADRPAQFVVVRGVDRDAVKTVDTGARRSPGDAFHFEGVTNAKHCATASRFALTMRASPAMRPLNLTNTELLRFYEMHRGISEHISTIMNKAPSGYGGMVAAAAYAYRFNGENVDQCVDAWLYGDAPRNHPCNVARERVIRDVMKGNRVLIPQEKCRLVAHSFNAAVEGKTWRVAKVPELVWIPGWTAR